MKKLFASVLALAMMIGLGATPCNAVKNTESIDVIYDNTKTITDPESPDAGKWGVRIPAAVQFTDDDKQADIPVELVGMNGILIDTLDVQIDVAVQSKHGLKMYINNEAKEENDPIDYNVVYGSLTMDSNNTVPITLEMNSKTKTSVKGTATMTGKATKAGVHKDELTYTVTQTNK